MLTLYASPESLYCAKLRIVLRHKQIDYREVMPEGGCGSASYRALVPAGTMPAINHDGLLLADSEAIAEYLEEIQPQPAMLPRTAAARARCRERARFHDTRLEPEIRALFRWVSPGNRGHDAVLAQTGALNQRLLELARLLDADDSRDSTRLTLGDCGFPISFAWLDAFVPILAMEIQWPASVLAYRESLAGQPAVSAELEAYAAGMNAWLDSRAD